jgi:hypothetical protein
MSSLISTIDIYALKGPISSIVDPKIVAMD